MMVLWVGLWVGFQGTPESVWPALPVAHVVAAVKPAKDPVQEKGLQGVTPSRSPQDYLIDKAKGFEAVLVPREDQVLAVIGRTQLTAENNHVVLKGEAKPESFPIHQDGTVHLAGLRGAKGIRLWIDGRKANTVASVPLNSIIRIGGPYAWTGQTQGFATFAEPVTAKQLVSESKAAHVFSERLLATTPTVTVRVALNKSTDVPDPKRIKPYRNALISQEYILLGFVRGRIKGVSVGNPIRIYRYGVFNAKQTDLRQQKKGDQCELTIELLTEDPNFIGNINSTT